jgi:hypothetical protein
MGQNYLVSDISTGHILHFLVSKSIYSNAEARLLPISFKANQHPLKTITGA